MPEFPTAPQCRLPAHGRQDAAAPDRTGPRCSSSYGKPTNATAGATSRSKTKSTTILHHDQQQQHAIAAQAPSFQLKFVAPSQTARKLRQHQCQSVILFCTVSRVRAELHRWGERQSFVLSTSSLVQVLKMPSESESSA